MPRKKVAEQTASSVTVDFGPMPYLLEELKKRAEAELRTPGNQIVWELNKTIGGRDATLTD